MEKTTDIHGVLNIQKILIIDDSGFQRRIISDILKEEGYAVITSENGMSGYTVALKESPDLILCDLLMPDLDGYEFLKKMREKGVAIPVIVLTSDIQHTTRKICLDLGAVDVLNKPVKRITLIPALQEALRKRSQV